MSKMGISVLSSYRGGCNFEALGLSRTIVSEYFHGVTSKISGIGLVGIEQKIKDIHKEVARLRKGKLNKSWTFSIQENLQRHSSDSVYGRGKYGSGDDIFYMVKGKGQGIWGLREMSGKWKNYWSKGNKQRSSSRPISKVRCYR